MNPRSAQPKALIELNAPQRDCHEALRAPLSRSTAILVATGLLVCLITLSDQARGDSLKDQWSAGSDPACERNSTSSGAAGQPGNASSCSSGAGSERRDSEDIELPIRTLKNFETVPVLPLSPLRPVLFDPGPSQAEAQRGIAWGDTLKQSLTFTTIMNVFRMATEPSTRMELAGPFWKDYFQSLKGLRGWRDGDEFYVNYLGHPLQGAVAGNILIQNDPVGSMAQFGRDKRYWKSRVKAFGWAAAVSTQFELGPYGEASLGNVGLRPGEKSDHPMAFVDLVVTPVLGTAWLIGEDMVDRFVLRKIEGKTQNRLVRLLCRGLLNPGRGFANMIRGRWWWHRDDRPLRESALTL